MWRPRDRSGPFARWWFTVDHVLMTAILALIAIGMVFSLAAGPAVAAKKELADYYFVQRHFAFALLSVVVVIAASTLSAAGVRRVALVVFLAGLAGLIAVQFSDPVNGARRWLRYGALSLQPSEVIKPAFLIISAWLMTERMKRDDMPTVPIQIALYLVVVGLLVIQPDMGQALLLTLAWGVLLFTCGLSWRLLGVLGVLAGGAAAGVYAAFPHVRGRIDAFFNPTGNDTFQLDKARESFVEGGWFGRGPGEGTVKSTLPDAHTDFVMAVIAEEYGIIACLILVGLFTFIVARTWVHIWHERNPFVRNATVALSTLFGAQALINIGVNVGLLPAKGMTLPFISYGGSSMLGLALSVGFLLALTRHRPGEAFEPAPASQSIDDPFAGRDRRAASAT